MTSSETPRDSVEIVLNSSEELTSKTVTAINSVSKIMARKVEALHILTGERGLHANPERLGRISESLFEAVDTLIFLAEDVRSLQQKIAQSQETNESIPAISGLTADEMELLTILQAQDGEPISMVAILEKGFGKSLSAELTVRKKHLQRTIALLIESLKEAEMPLVKIGQTRGTKYYLSRQEIATEEEVTLAEPQIERPVELEPAPVAERPPANHFETPISNAIDALLANDANRPIICYVDITREAFGSAFLNENDFKKAKELIAQDPRLEQISNFEFRIKGRDGVEEWIDVQDIRERLDQFITKMIQRKSSESLIVNLFKSVGYGRRFLTTPERNLLIKELEAHQRFVAIKENSFSIDISSQLINESSKDELRGMSSYEVNMRLSALGISGQTPSFRRRR